MTDARRQQLLAGLSPALRARFDPARPQAFAEYAAHHAGGLAMQARRLQNSIDKINEISESEDMNTLEKLARAMERIIHDPT